MLRKIVAVVLGLVACQAVFVALVVLLELVWPDYTVHVREWMGQQTFSFTTPMAAANLLFWALGFFAAGWTTARIARDRSAVWAMVGVMQVYAVYVHFYEAWSIIPWWYNVVVVGMVIPAAWCGARVALAPKVNQSR